MRTAPNAVLPDQLDHAHHEKRSKMDLPPKFARSADNSGADGSAITLQHGSIGRTAIPRALFLVVAAAGLSACSRADAQDDVKNFRKPILVVETEGHHAPIRSLIWKNPFSLLSAGLDKVVKVWDFGDGVRLARTIRPMIWRGVRGLIYSMAMSPKPDERGESFLAIAGYGVLSTGGDITVYRYPGKNQQGTGEPISRLFAQGAAGPGHRNTVLCLAFDPSGKILASGGADNTVILWERAGDGFRHRATLRGHAGEVHALAFNADGSRLITAGWINRQQGRVDGTLRVWDVATGGQVDLFPGTTPPSGINSMALHPNGQSVVIGRENGSLLQLDPRNLAQVPPTVLATLPRQGPVEHLAFSPDGRKLAVSLISDRANMAEPKTLACDVEIRDMPGGAVAHRHAGIPGLVYAASFSPDGRRLAYAGGHSQAILIRDVGNPQNPPTALKGQGTTIMSVGFTTDSLTVGFDREANAQPPAAGPIEGFDLKDRAYRPLERNDVQGPILQHDGWTLRSSLNPYRLEAVNVDGRSWAVALNRAREGNWWSYTIIPGNADRLHPRGTVAVGTEAGVVVFDLETGRRTRFFVGHSAPVTALAPSPDGRWLASGSVDQTIKIYPLIGCDTMPGFGATFRQDADSSWVIDTVEPRGFAAAMGLLAGDRIVKGQIIDHSGIMGYEKPDEIAELVKRVDAVVPNDEIGLFVRRTVWIPGLGYFEVNLPPLPSSKRNNPVFNLLVGLDKEWVLWTPRGFYDTSIEGDSRLLGWQINSAFDQNPPRPTEYLPIASFATKLMRGDVLDRAWNSDGLAVDTPVVAAAPAPNQPVPPPPIVVPLPEKIVVQEQPPRIEFTSLVQGSPLPAPGETWTVTVPNPRLKIQITAVGESKVKDRQVVIDDRLASAPLDATAVSVGEEVTIAARTDRPIRVAVKAVNDSGNPRSAWLDVLYAPPAPPPDPPSPARLPRLVMIGIGIDEFQNPTLPKLEFASNDAQRMTKFLPQHLIPPSGDFSTQGKPQEPIVLIGGDATAKGIAVVFDHVRDMLQKKDLVAGDMIAIFLESHVLDWGPAGKRRSVVAPADLGDETSAELPAITTGELSERLGELVKADCRVVLFLDGVHIPRTAKNAPKSDIKPWVRELQNDRRVITFVASKNGPARSSAARTERLGLFALGLSNAFRGAQSTAPMSIEAFKTAVVQEVRNLSNRYQEVGLYLPRSVQPRIPFARP
jgi:WD40 repeat protein